MSCQRSADAIEEDCERCGVYPGEADGLAWDEYRARYDAFNLLASPDRLRRAARLAGFVVASIQVAFDIPRPGTSARLEPAHTSLTEWRVADATWTLARYNDVSHLPRQRASNG